MNLLLRRGVVWDRLRGALWVLPTVSILFFLLAGAVLSRVVIGGDSPWRWLAFQGTAEDARQLLIVVSATMITVTGLVFALTIVALQIAAGQYSPRLLRNFMRDLGTQLVLSIFVGAFAYSTAGLFTVGIQRGGQDQFVPRLAVTGSLALGLASVFVLVYFIHHLTRSIQIDVIMGQVEREARAVIDDVYPDPAGRTEPEERCPDPPASAVAVPSARSGYIQAVQPEALIGAAIHYDLTVRLTGMVGEYVVEGTTIAWAWRRSPDEPPPKPELLGPAIGQSVEIGFERTMLQDVGFGIRRLVDIANKALSPAINDPYTAVQAVHHLSVLLCSLARRRLGDRLHRDGRGTIRAAVPLPQFADYLRLGTAQIRRYGAGEPALARSLIELLNDVGASTLDPDRRAAVARHLLLVLQDAERKTSQPADVELVRADAAAALDALGIQPPTTTTTIGADQ
jgi:uncharacterized membrane protein